MSTATLPHHNHMTRDIKSLGKCTACDEMHHCTCARIHVGMTVTGARDWSPDCLVHGLDTAWWEHTGRPRQQVQNQRLIVLQGLAAHKRNGVWPEYMTPELKEWAQENIQPRYLPEDWQ
jgi:hypothetical protein